jgi:hypothetical protein
VTDQLATTISGLLYAAHRHADGEPSIFERCERDGYVARVLQQAGMPGVALADAYREGADLRTTPALEAARRWAAWPMPLDDWETEPRTEPRRSGLLVCAGPMGTGKTQGAAMLMRLRVEAGLPSGRWLGCRGLALRELDDLDALSDSLLAEPFLVLDDVGAEGSRGKKSDALLASLVSRRADREPGPRGEQPRDRVTVITSNLFPPGHVVPASLVPEGVDPVTLTLTDVFGPRAADRFALWGEVVTCLGESMRPTAKPLDELPVAIRRANRLCSLVRRLDRIDGHVEPEVWRLSLEECDKQLGRILGRYIGKVLTRADVLRLADECDRIQAEGRATLAEHVPSLVRRRRVNLVPVEDLEAKRRREAVAEAQIQEADRAQSMTEARAKPGRAKP